VRQVDDLRQIDTEDDPFMLAAKESLLPKSLVSVMIVGINPRYWFHNMAEQQWQHNINADMLCQPKALRKAQEFIVRKS
jgi:hypothetical protein